MRLRENDLWQQKTWTFSMISQRGRNNNIGHTMADREVFAHSFCFQALSDEVDISVTDFESTRNQGYRLIDLLEDTMEGDGLRERINTVQDSLDRIQLLVSQKEKDVGDRYYHMAEFEVAFKDCEERVSDFKTRLQGVRTTDTSERHEKIQVCMNTIDFIFY